MGARIAQAALIIQTLRDAGYKNTSLCSSRASGQLH